MTLRYSLTIRWSDEDNAYLVELPELYGESRFAPEPSVAVYAAD